MKLRRLEIRKSEKCRLTHCVKLQDAAGSCRKISCNNCDQDRDDGQKTAEQNLSKHGNSQRHQKNDDIADVHFLRQQACGIRRISRQFQADQCYHRSHSRSR